MDYNNLKKKTIFDFCTDEKMISDLVIGHIQNDGSCVRVFPEKGKGWGVFIPKRIIPILIQDGKHRERNEVERCSYEENWSLL